MSATATAWTWENSPYKGNKLLVHLAMADVVNDQYEHKFFMRNGKLAEKCNMTRQTANAALGEMVQDGYLEVLGERSHGVIEYRFLFPEVSEDLTGGVGEFDTEVSSDLTDGVKKADTEQKTNSTGDLEEELNTSSDRDLIWEAYLETVARFNAGKGGASPRFSHARKQLIDRRLKDGYSVDELIKAVTGWEHSEWHRGENPGGKVYNEFERFLKSDKNIEMFMGYHEAAARRPRDKQEVNHAFRDPAEPSGKKIQIIKLGSDSGEDFMDD